MHKFTQQQIEKRATVNHTAHVRMLMKYEKTYRLYTSSHSSR